MAINIGDPAPEFSLKNQDGEIITLSQYKGKKHLVIYFYPKDQTPGCTAEACGFRDQYEDFTDIGAEVIGISADGVRSHKNFASQRRLPFQLLSDRWNKTAKAYGVKRILFLLPSRETFVVDKEGIVRYTFSSNTNIKKHITASLEVLKGL